MKTWVLSAGLPVLVWTVLSASAYASPILVTNFSFETLPVAGLPHACGTDCSFSNDNIPGWTITGTETGQFQPGPPANVFYFNSVPDGVTIAYTNGGSISQTVAPVVQLGVTYTLTVDVGVRNDGYPEQGTEALVINGHTIFATGTLPSPGNWSTFTATYVALPADVGSTITIQLASAGAQGDWDNVQLDDSTSAVIPEPATSAMLSLAAIALFGIVRRKRA